MSIAHAGYGVPKLIQGSATDGIEVEKIEVYAIDNAEDHQTSQYDLVTDHGVAVLRRSTTFSMALTPKGRALDFKQDACNLVFEFGMSGCAK